MEISYKNKLCIAIYFNLRLSSTLRLELSLPVMMCVVIVLLSPFFGDMATQVEHINHYLEIEQMFLNDIMTLFQVKQITFPELREDVFAAAANAVFGHVGQNCTS